ncbi:MAG: ABC transporter [Sphingobium sp.]|nr:ABC transporter [Sphingobium sp.]
MSNRTGPNHMRLNRTGRKHTGLILTNLLAMGLALGGCVSIGAKAPPQLLTITTDKAITAGQNITSQGLPPIVIAIPDVPRKLANTRVPVQVDATTVAYVKDAQWTDAPRDMFLRLLNETITADGARFVIDDGQYGLHPKQRLTGDLIDFGIDAQSKEAVVTYDATLTEAETNAAQRRRFTARVPVSTIKADRVADPINRAANQVAAEVAAWVKAG